MANLNFVGFRTWNFPYSNTKTFQSVEKIKGIKRTVKNTDFHGGKKCFCAMEGPLIGNSHILAFQLNLYYQMNVQKFTNFAKKILSILNRGPVSVGSVESVDPTAFDNCKLKMQ